MVESHCLFLTVHLGLQPGSRLRSQSRMHLFLGTVPPFAFDRLCLGCAEGTGPVGTRQACSTSVVKRHACRAPMPTFLSLLCCRATRPPRDPSVAVFTPYALPHSQRPGTCLSCGLEGHWARECPTNPRAVTARQAQPPLPRDPAQLVMGQRPESASSGSSSSSKRVHGLLVECLEGAQEGPGYSAFLCGGWLQNVSGV